MDLDLAGRTVLVTGATRGIGLAIVQRLAAEGADVGLCARDAGDVQQVVDGVRATGRRAHGVALDVTAPGAAAAFVEECRAALGRVDAVVASAGGAVGPPAFAATSDDDWEATYRWNVVHPAALVRAARPALAVEGGAAVLVGSISAARPSPWPQYAAAKAAQESVTRSLAAELAPDRIRVNCVRPGSIRFPGGAWERYADAEPEAYADFVARDLPWGALGRPDHVADVVAFVVSPRAGWINGAVIPVDGAQQRSSPYPNADPHAAREDLP
jgi:3-oxoacyl-[acyl-carrier protein] reductase